MKGMPLKLKIYTLFIMCLGGIFVYFGLKEVTATLVPSIIFFAILNSIAESLAIKLRGNTHVSVSFTIGLAAVLVFRSSIVAIIGFLSMLLWIEHIDGKLYHIFNSSIYKRLFNAGAYATTLSISVLGYNILEKGGSYLSIANLSIPGIVIGTFVFIIVDAMIFFQLMAILENKLIRDVLHSNKWAVFNLIALSPLGVITAIAYTNYGWFAVLLFFGPLLIARYSFKLYMDMRHVYFETIKALSTAMEAKDKYTNGHSYRVADYAVGIGEQMGLRQEVIDRLRTAAILHDIGKIGISDSILNKPGHLEENEYLLIQKHPEIGSKILSEVEFLADVSKIIKYHHERFDGKGYPEGLEGAQIPMEASILAVADAFDAMTSDRPYRKAMDQNTAMNILGRESGVQFHPMVVKSFGEYMKKQEGEMAHVG